MSTEPRSDAQPMTDARTTAITARGRSDPWADEDATPNLSAARAPRQFEPTVRERLRNLMDDENAYCS